MNNCFDNVLSTAILKCEGMFGLESDKKRRGFNSLYSFTTENINGYIDLFDLKNKKLLTVGSSGDQVINASLKGCNDITVVDICAYTKFYFYLKKAAIMILSYDEFINFFCYDDFPVTFKKNKNVFNKESFEKLKQTLRLLDYESYLFWDDIFQMFEPLQIRETLFNSDEPKYKVLKYMSLYLKDEETYNKTKNIISRINPIFIINDIFNAKLNNTYDNIFLSNIGQYITPEEMKSLIEKLDNNLNEEGKMLMCYLYKTKKDTKYNEDWAKVYDLENNYKLYGKYISLFESFIGTKGILFEDEEMKDSVMIYKKD